MLIELSIANFAIIDTLRLGFDPHLNVFTGETGAGKSIIVDAVSALVGERVTVDVVRAGSDRATVEGVFDIGVLLGPRDSTRPASTAVTTTSADADAADGDSSATAQSLGSVLEALGIEPEDNALILTREVLTSGRSLARINGRAVPISSLQRVARFLIDIHGQSAHLELLRPEQHVHYLDRYAGAEDLQAQVAAFVSEWRATRRESERLRRDEREIERRIELLRYQVDEIEAAHLRPGELEELEGERRRLANAERLGELSVTVYAALTGDADADALGALDLLASAQRALGDLVRIDDTLSEQQNSLEQGLFLLQDVASSVSAYQDEVAADPQRQAEVEERLDVLAKLRRKYGATIDEMLAYADQAARELDDLTHREERASTLQQRERELRLHIGALAAQLSRRRQAASLHLAAAMERELDDLNMRRARFQVGITQHEDPLGAPANLEATEGAAQHGHATATAGARRTTHAATPHQHVRAAGGDHASDATESGAGAAARTYAFSATGIDAVEFQIAPNPGEPFKPLARIASGGETARLMLALKTILSQADIVPVLIFDEIDSGISGRSGQIVGEKLWHLGQAHQVLCVTHLPQIAALGDRHYRVAKVSDDQRTTTQVSQLTADERINELGQMLGGANTAAARANAAEMLQRAAAWQHDTKPTAHR